MRPCGFHHTDETKYKMTLNHGRWNTGLTKETNNSVRKQSESLKDHWKICKPINGMLGKNHSERTKQLMSLNRIGQKNANWKGGVTEVVRLFRKSKRYQRWRREILLRDNFICQFCGMVGCSIVHHTRSVKEYPELRFEVDNGKTVCEECHKNIHKSGGDLYKLYKN